MRACDSAASPPHAAYRPEATEQSRATSEARSHGAKRSDGAAALYCEGAFGHSRREQAASNPVNTKRRARRIQHRHQHQRQHQRRHRHRRRRRRRHRHRHRLRPEWNKARSTQCASGKKVSTKPFSDQNCAEAPTNKFRSTAPSRRKRLPERSITGR